MIETSVAMQLRASIPVQDADLVSGKSQTFGNSIYMPIIKISAS
jgi:hypothetical protein